MQFGINISVAARSSRLSRAQVDEVLREINVFFPAVRFTPFWTETKGDRDLTTSLRLLEKTDFFTREVDAMLLERLCRIAIHSAKDLPEPLQDGLTLIALTRGVDASDALVFRTGETLNELPPNPRVGVSCARREEAVKNLLPQAHCADIRGAIDRRLEQLDDGQFDAIVVAEAALIRLNLTHLSRVRLDAPTAPLQGKLAVVARAEDGEMQELFRCIDDHPLSRV